MDMLQFVLEYRQEFWEGMLVFILVLRMEQQSNQVSTILKYLCRVLILLILFQQENYSPLQYAEVRFLYGDHSNSTRCINITVFDDMITENTNYFQVSITSNDTAVHVTPPNSTTIAIGDSDCEFDEPKDK